MGPQHILKLQPAFALWQECGSKAFWTAVSDCMERPKVRNLYVSVAGSLIAKQPQPWTRRLSATAGLFEQTDSRLLAIETPSSPGMTPLGGAYLGDLQWRMRCAGCHVIVSPGEGERACPEQDPNPLSSSSSIPVPMLQCKHISQAKAEGCTAPRAVLWIQDGSYRYYTLQARCQKCSSCAHHLRT